MLEMIRKGASTWFARVLLALLALSFVYWGADMRSAPSGANTIATVGGRPITVAEFERAMELEINQLSQRAGRRITQTEAKAFGIDQRVLQRLVAMAAIDHKAAGLGLGLSEKAAAESIARDPSFQGITGKFDRAGFDQLLRQIGMRERDFLELRRKEEVRDQLTQTVVGAIQTPKALVAAVHAWREETRTIEYFSLDAEKTITVADPDPAKLKEVYEANKSRFMAPEYRNLDVLLLSVDHLKSSMAVSDTEIATRYEEMKDGFSTPERRRVQQITFKDKAAAEAAKARIDTGTNFMAIAQELGLKDTDVELGLVEKKTLIDGKIADAAFALERDKVSGVVEGRFTTVLLRVPEIMPGKQPTLDEVKPKVVEAIQRDKALAEVRRMKDEVEDLRTAGKTNADIVAAKGLKLISVPETDASNRTKDGKPALEHPDAAKLIASGFDAKAGLDRESVELADGGTGWVTTVGTTPTRQKPFEEVEADVRKLYIETERSRLMRELAQKLADRVSGGEPIESVAKEFSAKVEKTAAITRLTSPQGLSEPAVTQAFALAAGKAAHAESADRKGRTVFRVGDVTPAAAPTKEQDERLTREVGQQLQVDIVEAFIAALQDDAGVKIDEAEFRRVTGATTTR